MKRKLLTSMLAFWVLAFANPGFAFVCSMPCKMTQKQMMDCVRVCSENKPPLSIGKAACVKLEIAAAPVFTALDFLLQQAPALAIALEIQPLVSAACPGLTAGQPLRGPPNNSLADFPTANAPPQLI
jgi:hypothetical protein